MKAKERYGISDICRKMGVTPGNYIAIKRDLKELFEDKYDGYVPKEDISEVIRLLKEYRETPEGFVSITDISKMTGFDRNTVRRYIEKYEIRPLDDFPRRKVYSLSHWRIIGFLNRSLS